MGRTWAQGGEADAAATRNRQQRPARTVSLAAILSCFAVTLCVPHLDPRQAWGSAETRGFPRALAALMMHANCDCCRGSEFCGRSPVERIRLGRGCRAFWAETPNPSSERELCGGPKGGTVTRSPSKGFASLPCKPFHEVEVPGRSGSA